MLAMVHHSHPLAGRARISLRELAAEPFVFFDPLAGTGLYDDILGLLQRYGVTPSVTQEVGEAMTILGLVAAGLGVSILPASYRRLRLEEICWLPLEEPDAISELWLVWAKHRELSAPARHFIELLGEPSLS
jgi:DNA-binding transcriptional LysR family regulator